MCYSRFYADINYSRLIRNLQKFKFTSTATCILTYVHLFFNEHQSKSHKILFCTSLSYQLFLQKTNKETFINVHVAALNQSLLSFFYPLLALTSRRSNCFWSRVSFSSVLKSGSRRGKASTSTQVALPRTSGLATYKRAENV